MFSSREKPEVPQCVRSHFSWLHPDLPFVVKLLLSLQHRNPGWGAVYTEAGKLSSSGIFCQQVLHTKHIYLGPSLCPSPQHTQYLHFLLGV